MKVQRSQALAAPERKNAPEAGKGAVQAVAHGDPNYNLLGQRLGRKGRDTRERILAATTRLLAEPGDAAISLSSVAREASLAMTTLYLYFSDLTELLLAVLDPVMASAEEGYVASLRERWPDDSLNEHCVGFVSAYFRFWAANSRILHLRNSYADQQDARMIHHRIKASLSMIGLLVRQMDGDPSDKNSRPYGMATVLLTGIERLLTIATDANLPELLDRDVSLNVSNVLMAEARLLELGIRDCRSLVEHKTA